MEKIYKIKDNRLNSFKDNLTRIIKFVRMEFYLNLKDIFLILFIIYGIIMINLILNLIFKKFNYKNIINIEPFYYIALFVGLIVIVSNSFTRIYEKKWTIFYLTLPGSVFQKVFSKFIFSVIIYFIINYLFFIFSYFILYGFTIIFSLKMKLYNLNYFVKIFTNSFFGYFWISSIFFFFSTIWEKNSFFNTVLVLFLCLLFLNISIFLLVDILIKLNIIDVFNFQLNLNDLIDILYSEKKYKLWTFLIRIIFYLIPFVFYILSYYSYKKKQITGR
ncbi:MAG: hypothetical protein N3A58_06075 [Spirochaetes bacterium]|nr:hypothetical protein [Spirochaetota bacterium]